MTGMTCLTTSTASAALESASISGLHQRFGERWTISYGPDLNVWSAERRCASGLPFMCDRDPAALAAKLAVAEAGQ
jgi:hypothetical protein